MGEGKQAARTRFGFGVAAELRRSAAQKMRSIWVVFFFTSLLFIAQTSLSVTQTQTAPSDRCTEAVELSKDLVPPVLVSRVEPTIPKALLQKKHSRSTATVKVVISTNGSISCATVLKTEDPDYAQLAVEAIKKWKYKPALKDGKPVPVCTTIFMSLTVR